MSRGLRSSGPAILVGLAGLFLLAAPVGALTDTLPAAIPDRDFWTLTEQLSEPDGSFLSDNLLSNESQLSTVAALLSEQVKPGGVYLGVGPEQNFTYIAAMRPKIAFITDIRRGNLLMHLMYKALFELSDNRADFVSRLFTKPRPAGLTPQSTAADLMDAYWDVATSSEATYQANLKAVQDQLVKVHGFPLSAQDLDGVAYCYHAFYRYGPRITYTSSTAGLNATGITYADLMVSPDVGSFGSRTYLASEEAFAFLKTMESRNLIVPVVGDFGGPKALRAVGQYVRDHDATVSAFYVSNVEGYLRGRGLWTAFCGNVAAMPLDDQSVFIRPMGANGAVTVRFVTRSGANTAGATAPILHTPMMFFNYGGGKSGSPLNAIAPEVAGCR